MDNIYESFEAQHITLAERINTIIPLLTIISFILNIFTFIILIFIIKTIS